MGIKRTHNGNIIPQQASLDKVFAKIFRSTKLFSKNLLTNIRVFAIIIPVLNIGVSPSGKASDSDSDISGVRIPAPQPNRKATQSGGFFVFCRGTRHFARGASFEATRNWVRIRRSEIGRRQSVRITERSGVPLVSAAIRSKCFAISAILCDNALIDK